MSVARGLSGHALFLAHDRHLGRDGSRPPQTKDRFLSPCLTKDEQATISGLAHEDGLIQGGCLHRATALIVNPLRRTCRQRSRGAPMKIALFVKTS